MLFTMFIAAIVLIVIVGIYSIIATHNLLRVLIALEIVSKSAVLLILLASMVNGHAAQAEDLIIMLIIIEVIVTAIGAVLCIALYAKTGSLDIRYLSKRKEEANAE